VPGIHDFRPHQKTVDGRDKPGHDEVLFKPAITGKWPRRGSIAPGGPVRYEKARLGNFSIAITWPMAS
jgi:hypothetical protein